MRLWRWLTAWTPQSRAENRRVKTDLLRILLPGVASSHIEEALQGSLPELQRDEALREIFEREMKHISQFETYTQLQSKLSELHGISRQIAVWREFESHSQWSALRERVTERLMESHWAQGTLTHLESFGINRSISAIAFYCLPSVEEVNRCHELHQINLIDARHQILAALLARDFDQLLERSGDLLAQTQGAQPPLFSEVINAIARFISETIIHVEAQTEHHDHPPAHVRQLVYTMRRLVATYPHQVFTLHITQVIDTWVERAYGSASLEGTRIALAESKEGLTIEGEKGSSERLGSGLQGQEGVNLTALDQHVDSASTSEETALSVSSNEGSYTTPPDEVAADRATGAELHEIKNSDEEASEFELSAKPKPEPEPHFTIPAFDRVAALSRVDPNFGGSQALTEAISAWRPYKHSQTGVERPSWVSADEDPDVLLLVKGEVRSFWSKWVRPCRFSAASPYPQLTTVNPSLDQLDSWLLESGGAPLIRNEVIRLLSAVGLRLPEVWELQALHASEDLGIDVAYWTRNSRKNLWSPKRGRWISPRKKLSVAITGFWDEVIAQQITLTPEQEEGALDADLLLGELASERMEDFDFGIDTTVAALDDEPFMSEPDHPFSFESTTGSSISPSEPSPLAESSVTLSDETMEILAGGLLSSEIGVDETLNLEAKPSLTMTQPFADDERLSLSDQEPDEIAREEEIQAELSSSFGGQVAVDRIADRDALEALSMNSAEHPEITETSESESEINLILSPSSTTEVEGTTLDSEDAPHRDKLDTLIMTSVDLPEHSASASTHDDTGPLTLATEMNEPQLNPHTTLSDLVPGSLREQAPVRERSTSINDLDASINKSTLGMTSLESEVTEVSSDEVKEISSEAPALIPSEVSDLNNPQFNKTTLVMTSLASEVTEDDQRAEDEVQPRPAEERTLKMSAYPELGVDESADHSASRGADLSAIELASGTVTPDMTISSQFPGLSADYLAVISEQTEEFRELLRLLAEQKRGLKNDLAQQAGISRTRVMIEIQKFNRQLEAAQLPKLILPKFETTRTAPVSGSYLHWLG